MTLGSDIAGVSDVDWALSTVSGRVALAHAILRRLRTSRGGLLGGPVSYGFNLEDLIGSDVPASVVENRVRAQALEEEEVVDCAVVASFRAAAGALEVTIAVIDGDGPFTLTIVAAEDLTIGAFLDGVRLEA